MNTCPSKRAIAGTVLLWSCFTLYFAVMTGAEFGESDGRLEKKRYIMAGVLLLSLVMALRPAGTTFSRIAALLFAGVATAPVFPKGQMLVVWRELPWPGQAAMWITQMLHFSLLPLFFVFYSMQPRPLIPMRWVWIVWLPILGPAGWGIRTLHAAMHKPETVDGAPDWILFATGLAVLVYGLGGLAALAVNHWRADSLQRRRLVVFVYGSILGWAPALLFLVAMFWAKFTTSPAVWSLVSTPYRLFALGMFVLAPAALIHAGWNRRLASGNRVRL